MKKLVGETWHSDDPVEHTYKNIEHEEKSQNKNGECTNNKINVNQICEQENNKNFTPDVDFEDTEKKEDNKHKYGGKVTMRKGDNDKIAKIKCEHTMKNKIVNKNYSANKKEYVAKEYINDTIEGIQDNEYQDNKNQRNKTYACAVRKWINIK